ncbi:MAG: NAD(P)/FAD-dependent oxidoreductase [Candidatus Omnitrophota bacterium]
MHNNMKKYDIAIIGGGVVGTSIARELSRYEVSVALLEKEEDLAFGVSKSNSGIVHPGTQNSPGSLKGRLCVRGNRLMRGISRELGVDFKQVGELIVAFSGDDISRLIELKRAAEKLGVPGIRIVRSPWLRRNEPNLSHEAVAALYAPTAGIVSPYRLAYDLAENAEKNGVEIYKGRRVERIERIRPAGGPESGPRFEVHTPGEVFVAKYVINAAGLYADDIANMAGITYFKIRPRKGEEFLLDKKKQYLTRHLLFPLPSKNSKGILITRTADGNPMIGPTAEDVCDKEDLSTSDEGLRQVMVSARKMVPSIDEKDIIAYFAGLRPAVGDDFIVRHETEVPGFVNVAGIQSPGLTAAPAIACEVAGILKKNGLGMKRKKFFHKHRKRSVHLFTDTFSRIRKLIRKDPAYGDIVCRCEMVSAKEVRRAIAAGAGTLDGIKFRTRAQSGRCHGGFCTTRLMKILSEETGQALTGITKRGKGSEIVKGDRTWQL